MARKKVDKPAKKVEKKVKEDKKVEGPGYGVKIGGV